jgi:hypothetical protein
MSWKTIGSVSHAVNGKTFVRRVARNSETGETERTFGMQEVMTQELTSRKLGRTGSDRDALKIAESDLKTTFK